MEKAGITLALWHFYEELLERDVVYELPLKHFNSKQIKVDASTRSVLLPKGVIVKLTDLERTLYSLFLRHPEGIGINGLWQYYSELLEIYRQQSHSSDPDWRERRIDDLCDTDTSLFLSHISHIRRKMHTVLDPVDAERFSIRPFAGRIYRISALKRCSD